MNTLAIDIPIAVYAYDRHKEPTDPKAVKRIGFYDKRTVLAETKFQRYYVKAKAIASRMAFKDYQKTLVDIDKRKVELGEKEKEDRITMLAKDNTGTFQHDQNYLINRNKQLSNREPTYNVYVPIKYYKINNQQVRGNIQGLLAFQKLPPKWHIYNGLLANNITLEYDTAYTTWASMYKQRFGIEPIDDNKDGVIDEADARKNIKKALKTFVKDRNYSWFNWLKLDCDGEFSSTSYVDLICVIVAKVGTLVLTKVYLNMEQFKIFNVAAAVIDFFRRYLGLPEPSGGQNDNMMLPEMILRDLGIIDLVKSAVKKATETLTVAPTEQEQELLNLLMGGAETITQDNAVGKSSTILTGVSNAIATGTAVVASLATKLMARITEFIYYVGPILQENYREFKVLFWESVNTTTATSKSFLNSAVAWVWQYVDPLNISFFVSILYQVWVRQSKKELIPIVKLYNIMTCTLAKMIRYAWNTIVSKDTYVAIINIPINGGLGTTISSSFVGWVNTLRRKQYKSLLLTGNIEWMKAEKKLKDYGNANKIDVDFENEDVSDLRPRLILNGTVKRKIIYSTDTSRETRSDAMVPNNLIGTKKVFPYVYVVATGEQIEGNAVVKYWYYYDYNYKKSSIFELYEVKQMVEGKETLSIKIPKEPAGDRCQRKINGTVVSGVPTWAYFIGATWSPYIFGAVVQFMVNGASMFSSPEYWKPQNILNTIKNILKADDEKFIQSDEALAKFYQSFTYTKGALQWINTYMQLNNVFPGYGKSNYFGTLSFLKEFLSYFSRQVMSNITFSTTVGVAKSVPDFLKSDAFKYVQKVTKLPLTTLVALPVYVLNWVVFIFDVLPCFTAVTLYNIYITVRKGGEETQLWIV